jgi:ankyrin repeat protein
VSALAGAPHFLTSEKVRQVGETPLHLSSINHNMELAKFLIDRGAEVNTRARGEASLAMAPLHWFLFMNDCGEGVEALLENGADVNALCYTETGDLISPLDIADKVSNRERERELLLSRGAKRFSDMTQQERSVNSPPAACQAPAR